MKFTRRGFLAMGAALVLSACGGSGSQQSAQTEESATEATNEQAQESTQQEEVLDFDGTGMQEAGDCEFYISSPGGTSEGGNVPKIVYKPGTIGAGFAVNVFGGDGTVCHVYVDGHERATINAGDVQYSVEFAESDATEGIHKVELVSEDGGATVYKSAQYEITLG